MEKVLGSLTLSSEELAYGKTKIFIRSPKTVSQEVCRCIWWGIECGTIIGSPEKEEGSIQHRTVRCLRKAPLWELSAGHCLP